MAIELGISFQLILIGLILDIAGAILIVIPLWNVGKRKADELRPIIERLFEEKLGELFTSFKFNVSISELEKQKKDEIQEKLDDLKDTIGEKKIEQWYARIGIITMIIGFSIQGIGVFIQWSDYVI